LIVESYEIADLFSVSLTSINGLQFLVGLPTKNYTTLVHSDTNNQSSFASTLGTKFAKQSLQITPRLKRGATSHCLNYPVLFFKADNNILQGSVGSLFHFIADLLYGRPIGRITRLVLPSVLSLRARNSKIKKRRKIKKGQTSQARVSGVSIFR